MSDNEDLLADDLGDHSLADYNLGNDEEDQLLADDFEAQNVPSRSYVPEPNLPYTEPSVPYSESSVPYAESSVPYAESSVVYAESSVPYSESSGPYSEPNVPAYEPQSVPFRPDIEHYVDSYSNGVDNECVVPNVADVQNDFEAESFNRYGEPIYDSTPAQSIPAEVPVSPIAEVPPMAPTVMSPNGEMVVEGAGRERFPAERPPGMARTPQIRDIPDSLDKVYIPRQNNARGDFRTWRNPHYQPRYQSHPYRRVNPRHPDFQLRPSFQPPLRPQIPQTDFVPRPRPPNQASPQRPPFQRPPGPPPHMQENRPPFPRPNLPHPGFNPERFPPPNFGQINNQPPPPGAFGMDDPRPNFRPPRANFAPDRPPMQFRGPNPFQPRPDVRGPMMLPNFNRPMRPNFDPRMQMPPLREVAPNSMNNLPQITIRQAVPLMPRLPRIVLPNLPQNLGKMDETPPPPGVGPDFPAKPPAEGFRREQEVRMLPLQLPPNIPFTGKKVLINPHFKGNIQPPIDGLTYIPTRIEKAPPSPTFENQFAGPIKDIDDAAERFIAEQRSALARAAHRAPPARRSPQRYIENTTIEVENELASRDRERERELLRRQEEFINANRAGLRRRMRSPSPPRRSPSPPPVRRPRPLTPPPSSPARSPPDTSEEGEYKRRLRDQENLRERVLRAKEVRRRKNAVVLQKQLQEREREKERERQQMEREQNPDKDQKQPERPTDGPSKEQRPAERDDAYRDRPRDAKLYERDSRIPEREQRPTDIEPKATERLMERKEKTPEKKAEPERQRAAETERKFSDSERKVFDAERKVFDAEWKVVETERKAAETERRAVETERKLQEVEKNLQQRIPDDYERDMTPPLPVPSELQRRQDERQKEDLKKDEIDDDALDLILDELDGILSDEDDTGRFKEKSTSIPEALKPKPKHLDLRSKLPPKSESKPTTQRQKIVFSDDTREKRRRDKSPPVAAAAAAKRGAGAATSDDRPEESEPASKAARGGRGRAEPTKQTESESYQARQRQKIIFEKKKEEEEERQRLQPQNPQSFQSRRVVLQRKLQPAKPLEKSIFSRIEKGEKSDPTQPTAGIFSRAVRTAIGSKPAEKSRIVVQRQTSDDPKVEVEMESDNDSLNEEMLLRDEDEMMIATVTNLPHGMTDTRLKTLAGGDVQSLSLDKERRSAKITFKSNGAAESFKKKFNNKMVAASRLTVILR